MIGIGCVPPARRATKPRAAQLQVAQDIRFWFRSLRRKVTTDMCHEMPPGISVCYTDLEEERLACADTRRWQAPL